MERLRKRADFLAAGKGFRAPTHAFVLQSRAREDAGPPRVGYTVSRQVGNAPERNRVRRRLREMMRLSGATVLAPGHDYVLIARRPALQAPFERLIADFQGALRRAGKAAKAAGDTKTGETPAGPRTRQ
jgi:ribonuclease P protein component